MIILNYAHPLTSAQLDAVRGLLGVEPEVRQISCELDTDVPFALQVAALADAANLSPAQWQAAPILVVLPSLSQAAAVMLAELHGRMGFFPSILRLKPVPCSLTPQFELAEIINLQEVRHAARNR